MVESRKPQRERSFFRLALPWINLSIAGFLSFGLMGVTRRLITTEHENSALELELLTTRGRIDDVRRSHERQLDELAQVARRERDGYRSDIESWSGTVREMQSRLSEMEMESRLVNDQTAESLHTELVAFREAIERDLARTPHDAEAVFREFEDRHREGLLLIYTEFDYRKSRDGAKARTKTVSGWGTGFFVSADGHIVTNKHVIQPWKFDSDLAAMVALGEITIDEKSLRICAWRAGTRALDDKGDPDFESGFNTHRLKNLHLVTTAPDSMRERDMEIGDIGPTYLVHALDNNDLAVLKADCLDPDVLPLAEITAEGAYPLRKLDPVMALGFPRGQNGLESGLAESSPSIGTVRKVEDTIHVTASIIPGNSGGPLVGPDGKVVGIVTRVYSETLGICIRIDHVRRLLADAASLDAGRSSAREAGATPAADSASPVR